MYYPMITRDQYFHSNAENVLSHYYTFHCLVRILPFKSYPSPLSYAYLINSITPYYTIPLLDSVKPPLRRPPWSIYFKTGVYCIMSIYVALRYKGAKKKRAVFFRRSCIGVTGPRVIHRYFFTSLPIRPTAWRAEQRKFKTAECESLR